MTMTGRIVISIMLIAYSYILLYTYRNNYRMSNLFIAVTNVIFNTIWCVYSEHKWVIISFAMLSVLWVIITIIRFFELHNAVISLMMNIPIDYINILKSDIKYSKKIIKNLQTKIDENNNLNEDDIKLLKHRIKYNELIIHKKETLIYQLSQIKDQTNKINKKDAIQLVISPIMMTI